MKFAAGQTLLLGLVSGVWLLAGVASAAPELSSVSLRHGNSPRLSGLHWAILRYRVENPDDQPADVRIVVTPKGEDGFTIYEQELTLAPQTRLNFRTIVTAGTRAERYNAQLFARGTVVQEQEMASKHEPGFSTVMFINDDPDLVYGKFTKNEGLAGRYSSTFMRSTMAPRHWSAYDRCHLLVIYRPDFATLQPRQVEAIREYVARGGTVLFGDPIGLQDAWQRGFGDLLPLRPLRLRPLLETSAFEPLGGSTVRWPEGTDFLETAPVGKGVTTAWHGERPVLRWGRHGLGYVGACAINPSQNALQDGPDFLAAWNHILQFGGRSEFASTEPSPQIDEALNRLTGVQIPRPGTIRGILLAYFLLVLAVVGAGMFLRHQVLAWCSLLLLALGATVMIFGYASHRNRDLGARVAAVVSFEAIGTDTPTSEDLVSLYTKAEQRSSVTATSVDTRLRLPAKRRSQGALRDPVRLVKADGTDRIAEVALLANSKFHYAAMTRLSPAPLARLPRLEYQARGLALPPWTVPPGLEVRSAALVCRSQVLPATVSGGRVRVAAGTRQGDAPVTVEEGFLQDYLLGAAAPGPFLALFTDAASRPHVPADFEVIGRDVLMVPVREALPEGPVTIAAPLMGVDYEQGDARLLRRGGAWVPIEDRREREYRFFGRLPPYGANLTPQRLRITFEPDNRGGNMRYDVLLKDGEQTIAGSRRGNTYEFRDLAASVIDPATGRLAFVIRAAPIKEFDNLMSQRMNTWVVRRLELELDGDVPAGKGGSL